jgi:hypothetical protein
MQGQPEAQAQGGHAIDHMLRGGVDTQLALTRLADMKANILITIAALVVTFTLPWYTVESLGVPVLVLDFFGIGAILFSVLASKPRVPRLKPGTVTADSSSFTVLFFGNIASLTQEEYEKQVGQLVASPEAIYKHIARNLHGMGSVLQKKYYFLNLAYISFIAGLLLSIIPLLLGVEVTWFTGR